MTAETAPEQTAPAGAADAEPAEVDSAVLQHLPDAQQVAAGAAEEPLRSVPDSLTKVLQGASFEAAPLGAREAGASQQPQQHETAESAEQPADAVDRKRRRLGRRCARAAKQWRKLTRQQQNPDPQSASSFRTAPLAGIRAGQLAAADASQQPSAPADAQQDAASHAEGSTAGPASQPAAALVPDDYQGRTQPNAADHQLHQQQPFQAASPTEAPQGQAAATPSNVQAAEAPAGWGLPRQDALAEDGSSAESAAAEAAATAARQQQALQRAEELRVTDTLQPPPPLRESMLRTSSGRVKVGDARVLRNCALPRTGTREI